MGSNGLQWKRFYQNHLYYFYIDFVFHPANLLQYRGFHYIACRNQVCHNPCHLQWTISLHRKLVLGNQPRAIQHYRCHKLWRTLYVSGNINLSLEYRDKAGNTSDALPGADFMCTTASNRLVRGKTFSLTPADCERDLYIRAKDACGTAESF